MTTDPSGKGNAPSGAPLSTSGKTGHLPFDFDPGALLQLRVRPADFARMCRVSRQAVSTWIKRGVITLGPDGKLDPVAAGRQVLARTDPARLRARVFKDTARDVDELRAQVRALRAERDQARAERDALRGSIGGLLLHADDVAVRLAALTEAIVDDLGGLARLADDREAAAAVIDELECVFFWRTDPAELVDPDLGDLPDLALMAPDLLDEIPPQDA